MNTFDQLLKLFLGFIATMMVRLVTPFVGLANISPLMATELPSAKSFGPWIGGLYGAMSMFLLDVMMGKVGPWTILTSFTYGVVGIWGYYFLRDKKPSARNFVVASIIGTLFLDVVTGIIAGPLFFGQSMLQATLGQIPFTAKHLAGNMLFAMFLSPWFYKQVTENERIRFPLLAKTTH